MINEREYVELGLGCADICRALDRGMRGKTLDDLSQSVCEAINQLTTWVKSMMRSLNGSLNDGLDRRTVAEIQRKVIKQSGRNAVSRLFHAKNDKETIAAWKINLNRILHVFNVRLVTFAWFSLIVPFQTELAINAHTMLADMHRTVVTGQESAKRQHHSVSVTIHPSIKEC